jgi:pimeloyl-ACP methyl ester carboxylesterase
MSLFQGSASTPKKYLRAQLVRKVKKVKTISLKPAEGCPNFKDTIRLEYAGARDGAEDWALLERGKSKIWMVCLHGHGSAGDQLYTRPDVAEARLRIIRKGGFGILSPNLRGNAWMGPDAVSDLRKLLTFARTEFDAEKFVFFSGSMGATGSLIYAALHPEDAGGVIAGCPATDLSRYHSWLCQKERPSLKEIREAIEKSYGGTPSENPGLYRAHSAFENAEKLTMPVHLIHGGADLTIPVTESRALAEKLSFNRNFLYEEIPGGGHDAPIQDKAGQAAALKRIIRFC